MRGFIHPSDTDRRRDARGTAAAAHWAGRAGATAAAPGLAAVVRVTLNHQVHDGDNFTVEGLRPEVGGQVVAVIASATWVAPIPHAPEVKAEVAEDSTQARMPTPVESVPVSG